MDFLENTISFKKFFDRKKQIDSLSTGGLVQEGSSARLRYKNFSAIIYYKIRVIYCPIQIIRTWRLKISKGRDEHLQF